MAKRGRKECIIAELIRNYKDIAVSTYFIKEK